MMRLNRSGVRAEARLNEAIRATRQAGPVDALSDDARDRILNAAHRQDQAEPAPLPRLFVPARQILLAGALPLLLAGAFLLLLVDEPYAPPAPGEAPATASLQVAKQGDQIVFTIANGTRSHVVHKSTDPRFNSGTRTEVVDGSYADPLSDRSNLVFYRID